jgi:ribosomal protein S18 acetylase RimI-like enzyme
MEKYFRDIDERFDYGEGIEVVAGHPLKAFIKDYVLQYDNDFYVPLSERVDIEVFSKKLSDLSTTFIIFKDGVVAGLICSYFYQPEIQKGFITLVHTKHECRGQHLSLPLLDAVKKYAQKKGFKHIGLFVSKQQTSAYNLYSRHGFVTVREEENGRCQMECNI